MYIFFSENPEIWDKLFAFVFEIFLFIFDIFWKLKIPLTDITFAYWIIFWMVVKLSIFAVHGTSTNYNQLPGSISNSYAEFATSRSKRKQDKLSMRENIKNQDGKKIGKREVKRKEVKKGDKK